MKKFTDEQIIKALECCNTDVRENPCPKCAFYNKHRCSTLMVNAVSDLISRYKAKNERLLQKLQQAKSEALMHAFSKFAGHSDYHGDTILCQLTCMAEGKETKSAIPIDMNKIKSKAIKDFAERLKEKLQWDVEFYNKIVFEDDIDDLVKEMTEEKSDV